MSANQEEFLNRIRASLGQTLLPGAEPEHPGSFRGYRHSAAPVEQLVANFKRELETLSGHVHVLADIEDVATEILGILRQHQAAELLAWPDAGLGLPGLSTALTEAGVALLDHHLPAEADGRAARLAAVDGVRVGLTGAHGGLADTGAVALMSGPGRSRMASLLPPVHIALLPRAQLYPSLPAFLAAHPEATSQGSNLVFITGPSRSADIEMTLSIGVHGPGEIHVIITP